MGGLHRNGLGREGIMLAYSLPALQGRSRLGDCMEAGT